MTTGEKMIWAAVFGQVYATRLDEFRVDNRSTLAISDQREAWEREIAVWATEQASNAVHALRSVDTASSTTSDAEGNSGMAAAMRRAMLDRSDFYNNTTGNPPAPTDDGS